MKSVYLFGATITDSSSDDVNVLGGKGANLAEMSKIKLPVPPGLTISTDVCNYFLKNNLYPKNLYGDVNNAIKKIEQINYPYFFIIIWCGN